MTFLASTSLSGSPRRHAVRSLFAALGVLGAVACGGITEGEDPNGRGNQLACGVDGCGGSPPPDGTVDGPAAPAATPTPTAAPTDTPPAPTATTTPTATATAPDEPPPPAPVALAQALTRAQQDALWDAYWESHGGGGVGTGGGPSQPLDPDDLFLQLSDQGVSCSSPHVELSCGGHWSATLVLPPALQKVGVYDLSSPELSQYSSMGETTQPYSATPGDCGHGMGSFLGGTLEIVSIDATQVRFKVQTDTFFAADPSGEYTALRCPQ